ncbi:MAG: helix-turn-helix transcriptional regulator, partial [Clostridium sp.]
ISKTSRKVRIIHPYKLVFKQSFWYLYGFCETSNDFRLFKVNRIVYYKLLNKNFTFKIVDKIDFKRNDTSSLCFNEQSNAIYEINLEYDKIDEFLLTDKIDAKFFQRINNKEKGLIVFKVSDLDWAADFIINLQCRVKVLYPKELKEKVIIRIKNMNEIYKDDI